MDKSLVCVCVCACSNERHGRSNKLSVIFQEHTSNEAQWQLSPQLEHIAIITISSFVKIHIKNVS